MKTTLAPPTIRIPARNTVTTSTTTRSLPHPRSYERVKNFLKQMLRDMIDCSEHNPSSEDALSTLLRETSAATVVDEFRNQLELYWCNEWPFNVPIADGHPYQWWVVLKAHPYARVLAVGLLISPVANVDSVTRFLRPRFLLFSSTQCQMNAQDQPSHGSTHRYVQIRTLKPSLI